MRPRGADRQSLAHDALTRLGEMLKAAPKHEGGRPSQKTGSDVEPVSSVPTLADLGIDKKVSARAQKLAALPPDQFAGGSFVDRIVIHAGIVR